TSAKVACLAAAGELEPGKVWRQESIVGSVFEASYARDADLPADQVVPTIRGSAYVSGQGTLLFGADDPFAYGLQAL
ncbi:MAG TPA: proline racemase family protein, partial [Bordetella sp.]|uniref:proline racemase family protein n=1 Tax=Bordetella sp. TaxID=28081 RepID=UPI002ED5DDC0